MKRAMVILSLTVGILTYSRPASAGDFWSWLEEFSGPGPFKGYSLLFTGCAHKGFWASPLLSKPPDVENGKNPPDTVREPLACVYFDRGAFSADAAHGYPKLNVSMYDVGGAVRLLDGLDLGGGFGRTNFNIDGTDRGFGRLSVTPLRIVMRPILLGVPQTHRQAWMGILSVYWKETLVKGPINGQDLDQSPATFQREDGDLVRSFGIVVDLTAPVACLVNQTSCKWW